VGPAEKSLKQKETAIHAKGTEARLQEMGTCSARGCPRLAATISGKDGRSHRLSRRGISNDSEGVITGTIGIDRTIDERI